MKALFFWAGGEIPNLFKYCIESFVKNGFETIVYSPEPDINKNCLANDIDLRQSDEILPIEILYKFKQRTPRNKPCYSAFSNLFRAKLIQAHPGSWYFDTDVFCIANATAFENLISQSKDQLIVGRQDNQSLNGAVLSASSKSVADNFVKSLFEYVESKNYVHDFGDFGPAFLNNFLSRFPQNIRQIDQNIFYPIHYGETNYFYDPDFLDNARQKIDKAFCVHLWNECLSMASVPINCPPPKSSLLYELMVKNIQFDSSYALPKKTMKKLFYPAKWGLKKTINNIFPSMLYFIKRQFKKYYSKIS